MPISSEIEKDTEENPLEEDMPYSGTYSVPKYGSVSGEYSSESDAILQERTLFCAILERAFLDLKPNVPKEVRRGAIEWFSCKNPVDKDLSYKFIVQELHLSTKHQKLIAKEVKKAQEIQRLLYGEL